MCLDKLFIDQVEMGLKILYPPPPHLWATVYYSLGVILQALLRAGVTYFLIKSGEKNTKSVELP